MEGEGERSGGRVGWESARVWRERGGHRGEKWSSRDRVELQHDELRAECRLLMGRHEMSGFLRPVSATTRSESNSQTSHRGPLTHIDCGRPIRSMKLDRIRYMLARICRGRGA